MMVRSMSQSYELIRALKLKGKAVHGQWKTVEEDEELLIHMVQIDKQDLDREAIPCIQELEKNAAFTDLYEIFLERDSLYLAFFWRDGTPLKEFLEAQSLTMEERFQIGKAVLERMLILNLPLFLQRDELDPQEILIAPDLSVNFYYGFADTGRIAGAELSEAGGKIQELLQLLFEREFGGGLYPELNELGEFMKSGKQDTFLEFYQEYLSLSAVVIQERKPPEEEKKEPFLSRLKKKTGMLITLFKIAAGLAVLAASVLLLLDTWREKVYPVVESAYLVKTFTERDREISDYTGQVEIFTEDGAGLLFRGKLEVGKRAGYGMEYGRKGELHYEGNYLAGLYDGTGSLYDEAGVLIYEGTFAQGKMDGNGTARDFRGRILYEGEFKNGLYEGEGRLYQDGSLVYEGNFAGGVPNGEGASYENGKVKEKGQFEKGLFTEGKGNLYDEEGRICYSGAMAGGKPEGEGTAYEGEAVIYEGSFKKGEYDGEGKLYSDGRLVYRGDFSGGMYDGLGMLYAPQSGMPVYGGSFRLGLYDGEGMEYDSSGNLKYQGSFLLGVYNGYGTLYDPATGKIQQEGEFRNGLLVTPKEELAPEEDEGTQEEIGEEQASEEGVQEDGGEGESALAQEDSQPSGPAADEGYGLSGGSVKGGPGSE